MVTHKKMNNFSLKKKMKFVSFQNLLHALHGGQLWVVHIWEIGVVDAVGGGVGGIGQRLANDVLAGSQSGAELFEQILAGVDGSVRSI